MKTVRYVDSLGMKWEEETPTGELGELAADYRHRLIEAVADHDDAIMEAFLEDQPVSEAALKAAIRAATLDLSITPVLCGSAFKNKGVQPLLDAITDYLPSPLDIPPVVGTVPRTGAEETRAPSLDEPFSALAFKVMTDPYVGKLTYFRVYSGQLKAGSAIYNATSDKKERVGRILQMHANHREEREEIGAGEIAAAVGLKFTTTGDTLTDPANPILLENIVFPEPVIEVAVEPKTKSDQDKLAAGLARLSEEDPTFRVKTHEETGQTLIAGMGELHLEIIVDRLLREFKVDANVGKPQVAYREAVRRKAEHVRARFVRQTGGRGQFGDVIIDLEPNEPGAGYEFVNKIIGGSIPKEYIGPVDQGIQEAIAPACSPGSPSSTSRSSWSTARSTTSTPRRWRSRSPAPWRSRTPCARPARLLEPVFASRSSRPRSTWRRHRQPQLPPGPDRRDGAARQRRDRHGPRAALGDVRVLDRAPVDDTGPRHVHDAVPALRGSAEDLAESIVKTD